MKFLVLVALLLTGCNAYLSGSATEHGKGPEKIMQADTLINYSLLSKVVFEAHCVECHARMKSYEKIAAKLSDINEAVFVDRSMPEAPQSLNSCERALLKYWIERGAPQESNDTIEKVPECVGT